MNDKRKGVIEHDPWFYVSLGTVIGIFLVVIVGNWFGPLGVVFVAGIAIMLILLTLLLRRKRK